MLLPRLLSLSLGIGPSARAAIPPRIVFFSATYTYIPVSTSPLPPLFRLFCVRVFFVVFCSPYFTFVFCFASCLVLFVCGALFRILCV